VFYLQAWPFSTQDVVAAMVVLFQNQKNRAMEKSNFKDTIHSENPVLVDFFATWCGPCQMLTPVLQQVKDRLGKRVTIIKIDVDKNAKIAAKYKVRGVPTLLLFQNGKQLWRQSGVLSTDEIINVILEKSN
jgi:thioredoxin 1